MFRRRCSNSFLVSVSFFAFLAVLCCCLATGSASILPSSQGADEDGCDWSGSGFDLGSEDGNAIRPLRLRCTQGTVEWSYPRGALRVTLAPNLASKRKDGNGAVSRRGGGPFKACVKTLSGFDGARIYADDGVSLRPLYLPGDGLDPGLPRCFASSPSTTTTAGGGGDREETVVLYVEADGERREFRRRVASFAYDITPASASVNDVVDPDEECRPCDDAELLKAYCSSDFAVRGKIRRVTDEERLDRSEIVIETTRVLRRSLLSPPTPSPQQTTTSVRSPPRVVRRELTRVYAPLRCRVRTGPGEYLFAATSRLGDPFLTCASTMAQWVRLMRAANADGRAPCVLDA